MGKLRIFRYILLNDGLLPVGMGNKQTWRYKGIQPVITLIASALILGEKVSAVGYIGCSLILAGVWISDRLSVKRPGQQHG